MWSFAYLSYGEAPQYDLVSAVEAYLQANLAAVEAYAALSERYSCDFQRQDSTVYSVDEGQKIEKELIALERLGYPAVCPKESPVPFEVAGAVTFPDQARFHPLKFLAGIAPGLPIHERTAVRELIGTTAVTDRGRIRAKRVVVATHFPFLNKHGSYFLKLYQHRSYVLALKNAANLDGMYVGAEQNSLSFRNTGDLLLLGGGGHRTGKQGGAWQELRNFATAYYPQATEMAHWATQDCVSLDGLPYIGHYSRHTPHVYVATGFNKWGMTNSMVAARILTEQILRNEDPYGGLFSPSRSILQPQLAINAASAVSHLLRFTTKRCPHMGCALKWNKAEHTWDCPCHGSRFTEDGKLLNNPATEDLPGETRN